MVSKVILVTLSLLFASLFQISMVLIYQKIWKSDKKIRGGDFLVEKKLQSYIIIFFNNILFFKVKKEQKKHQTKKEGVIKK